MDMDSNGIEPRQREDGVMEVPEIDGDLLVELLDASLAAKDAGSPQLGFPGDVDGGDCWVGSHELNGAIHTHQDCEDCDLDAILSDFEEYGSPRPGYPAPYAVFDDDTLEWAETADAGMGPFAGGCMGDWYMDGMVMAIEWEEEGGEAGAEQVYGSPLWE
ncbi:hypothetical protein GQ55_5G154200 [Panicum hallii var. hallii]|uniref:Uncharacterized protein n=1 Tax=Panicum hallii var. hallii TaxID=1504633 RepID=A0A2T7DGN1_9POAL|nr:hypothetical protein GQ55_5G154200 [Panicum hallii var. hallii]